MLEFGLRWAGRLSPWLIIGGLSYAALFVQPSVHPQPLNQPLLENRDAFFDAAALGPHWRVVGQNGALLKSADDGQHWQREELPERDNLQGIAVSAQGRWVVVGNQGQLWVSQADAAWQKYSPLGADSLAKLLDVAYLNGHFWTVGEMGSLLRGTPDGEHWEVLNINEDITLNSIRPGTGDDLWIAAEFGRLLHSRDQGQSWSSQELGTESLRAVHFQGPVGVTVGNRGGLYLSEDAGESWRAITPFTDEHLYDVTYEEGRWIVTGDRGALYRNSELIPDKGWQNWSPEGLGKSYYSRLLNTERGVLLVGKQLGLLNTQDLRLLIKETQ